MGGTEEGINPLFDPEEQVPHHVSDATGAEEEDSGHTPPVANWDCPQGRDPVRDACTDGQSEVPKGARQETGVKEGVPRCEEGLQAPECIVCPTVNKETDGKPRTKQDADQIVPPRGRPRLRGGRTNP